MLSSSLAWCLTCGCTINNSGLSPAHGPVLVSWCLFPRTSCNGWMYFLQCWLGSCMWPQLWTRPWDGTESGCVLGRLTQIKSVFPEFIFKIQPPLMGSRKLTARGKPNPAEDNQWRQNRHPREPAQGLVGEQQFGLWTSTRAGSGSHGVSPHPCPIRRG